MLRDRRAPREQRAEALKFLVHFVADLHQPMHTIKEAAGGNGIDLRFLGADRCGPRECNLHAVWDREMVLKSGLRREEYAGRLEQLIASEHLSSLAGGTPEKWANEGVPLAQAAWAQTGSNLDEAYHARQIRVVDRQMALAGLRLARLLNESIGKMTPRDFQ